MNEKSYQKLAELVDRAPRLLGPGGLFGGVNQNHGLMVDFIKFVRGLALGNSMSPETVNIRSFIAYLGERENAEDVARKLYDMRQNGEIGDDPHVKAKNTLFNLAETLIDLGVGEKPENVGADYEGVLSRAQSRSEQSRSESAAGGRAEAPQQEKDRAKTRGPATASQGVGPKALPKGERPEASPETPFSTMGESLTDNISIAQGEEDQAGVLAVGAETQAGTLAIGAEMETTQLSPEQMVGIESRLPSPSNETVDQQQASDLLPQITDEQAAVRPEADEPETEGMPTGRGGTYREGALREPKSFRMPQVPVAGITTGEGSGEAIAGTKATPGAERRHIAQLPDGGRMLRKGPKKQSQKQEQRQGRGASESGQDQGRQTAPGRNPAKDFANSQAAQPQKSRVGRRVAGGAGIAGSLALMKGMYGGAAANAASFSILQTILDLLT